MDRWISTFQIREAAVRHAVATHVPGESTAQFMARVQIIAEYMLEPLEVHWKSAEIGEPANKALN